MRSNYPAAILANFEGDYRAAYEHLSKAYLALERQFSDVGSSRFFEVARFERREQGRQERYHNGIEQPFHFAASSIIAGGKPVGEVVYTDH